MADILIADDHRFIRDMVRITLSTQGWTIAEASSVDQALELARRDPPHAMLLDVTFDEAGSPLQSIVNSQSTAAPKIQLYKYDLDGSASSKSQSRTCRMSYRLSCRCSEP